MRGPRRPAPRGRGLPERRPRESIRSEVFSPARFPRRGNGDAVMSVETPSLPAILPVFPLTGVLLLPGTLLPLHVFEPRYRHLVEDVLAAGRMFGMIQPVAPRRDNRPLPGPEDDAPALYAIGCAGQIERDEKLPGGRYLLTLRGYCRFRALEELAPHERGYRRVRADYAPFAEDLRHAQWRGERPALIEALADYCRAHALALESKNVEALGDSELLHAIAVTLPFHPSEKQALLESPTLNERQDALLGLLRMGGDAAPETDAPPGPVN